MNGRSIRLDSVPRPGMLIHVPRPTEVDGTAFMMMDRITMAVALVLALAGTGGCSNYKYQPRVGEYTPARLTSGEVIAAAQYAVGAKRRALEEARSGEPVALELVRIVRADEQVVSGKNYRMVLEVKLNGATRTADATVWWQSWRVPDPYQLTSWKWK